MTSDWEENYAPVRKTAMDLQKAIEDTTGVIFGHKLQDRSPIVFRKGWKDVHMLFWPVDCKILEPPLVANFFEKSLRDRFYFRVDRHVIHDQWVTSFPELEAVLSMWVWSLRDTS
ncbi:hypothetical protein IWX49DRAFT_556969 [Phyllosticta citricarpa]